MNKTNQTNPTPATIEPPRVQFLTPYPAKGQISRKGESSSNNNSIRSRAKSCPFERCRFMVFSSP